MSSKAISVCIRFLSSHIFVRRFLSAASLLIAMLFASAASAHAAIWTVTDLSDSATDTGSLRYALTNAATGDTITFQSGLTGTISLGSALPAIAGNLTIAGPGAGNLTVSGANAYTVFTIDAGATVSISGLTIANGYVNVIFSAGGILNEGTLTVSDCTFTGNSTAEPYGGGAILNLAYLAPSTLAVINSTFSGNFAGGSDGGAIASTDLPNATFAATLTVTNSTFSGNSASGGSDAGAVFVDYSFPSSTASVFNDVFVGNSASGTNSAGGLYLLSSASSLSDGNNVFFENTGGDTGGFTASGTDVTGKDPMLLPLGNYGGTTQTMLPLSGSAAICAGSSTNVPSGVTTDQRGFPLNSSCVDAGAVQTNYLTVNTSADSNDGSCTSTTCSLRDAIAAANSATEGDIDFAPSLNGQTITLGSALPQLSGQENIIGPGANLLTVSGNNSASVFFILSGAQVTLDGLTLANANAIGSEGGGIQNAGTLTVMNSALSGNTATEGGGLFTELGSLTVVTNSTFSGNTAAGAGAGIANAGTLNVTNSTFENNSAVTDGGGVFNTATLSVTNSTFSGNSSGEGGGIFNNVGSTVTMTNGIFSGNSAISAGDGAGLLNGGGTLNANYNVYYNNLDASTSEDDCNSCTSDTNSVDATSPVVTSLGYYGGSTQTMPPLAGGVAFNFGSYQAGEPTTDQRGAPRPSTVGDAIAVGSVQVSGNVPMIGSVTPNQGPVAGGTSVTITGTGLDTVTALDFGSNPSTSFTITLASGTTLAFITAISPAATSAGVVDITATDSVGTSATSSNDQFTYLPPPVSILPTTGAAFSGTYGVAYSQTFTASGGTSPYTFSLTGSLPNGVTLSSSGVLSGTPASTGPFSFQVTATDSSVPANTTTGSYTLTISNPTIAIAPATLPSGTVSTAYNLTLTASGGISPYTFTAAGLPAGLTLSSSGILSGTPTTAGSSTVTVTATDVNGFAGNQPYTLTIGKGTATVTLGDLNQTYTGSPLAATATTTPTGLTVNITYNGSSTAPAAAGTYAVVATVNDPNYTGSASGTLTIAKATATVTLSNLNQTYTGSPLSATATTTPTGLTVNITYNGSSTAPTAAGTYAVVATVNDPNYTGSASGTLTIAKATATVTLSNLNQTYTGSPLSATATTTPTGLTVNITYNGSSTAPAAAGSYAVVATVSDPNYTGSASGTLTIAKATATVTLSNLNQTYTGSPLAATATTTPTGLTVNITYNGSSTAPTAAGSYAVVATVSDPNYTGSASGTLTIAKATATVTLSNLNQTYTGSPLSVTATTTPIGLTVNITYNGSPTAPTAAGTYAVVATINDPSYTGSTSGTLVISKGTPVLTWNPPAAISYGTPLSSTQLDATSTVAGTFTYTPPSGTVLSVGASQTLSATFVPSNTTDYNTPAAVTTSITVTQATLDVTANNATRVYGAANPAFSGTVTGAVNGNTFAESFATAATPTSNVGTYAIVPSVTGANVSDYTVDTTDGTLTVTQAGTTTTLSASASSLNAGQSVTLTAQVRSATTGTPTGSIDFYDGATLLGTSTLSGGSASFTTSVLNAGTTNSLTAAYQGSTDFAASTSSTAVTIPVGALDFTLSYQGGSTSEVTAGTLVTYTFQVSPTDNVYPGEVTFNASGLPQGVTGTFTPSTVAANGGPQTVTLQIPTAPVTAQKDNPFKRGGAPMVLGFLLLPLLGARRMRNSRLGRSLMLLLAIAAGGIGLASLSGCGSSGGFQGPKPQNYTITVTADSGTVQHSFTVTLIVEAPPS